ncbi:hypothetical protein H5410_032091 [Solanum commersonii]|uniref:Uncharacterized protein n=1 Tax=Solanum commersonii TaxID=4109 RepID=A0A9J5YK60_SOLCO|nr:hypothetical protein H5410_032091 [Solanum commersonii]
MAASENGVLFPRGIGHPALIRDEANVATRQREACEVTSARVLPCGATGGASRGDDPAPRLYLGNTSWAHSGVPYEFLGCPITCRLACLLSLG